MEQILDSVVESTFAANTFNVLDFGAVPDGVANNTEAFQKAIKECTENSGGKVLVPKRKVFN